MAHRRTGAGDRLGRSALICFAHAARVMRARGRGTMCVKVVVRIVLTNVLSTEVSRALSVRPRSPVFYTGGGREQKLNRSEQMSAFSFIFLWSVILPMLACK